MCTDMYMHRYMHMYIHKYIYVCMDVCMDMCMDLSIDTHMGMCLHMNSLRISVNGYGRLKILG